MAGYFLFALLVSTTLLATSNAKPSPHDVQLVTHPAQGHSAADTREAIARGLQAAALSGRDANHRSEQQLEINLQDVSLFKLGGTVKGPSHGTENTTSGSISGSTNFEGSIEVKCKNCYLSTLASAEINIKSDTNDFSTALQTTVDKVTDQVNETVTETFDALEAYFKNTSNWDDWAVTVWNNIRKDNDLDLADLLPPNINVSSFDDDLIAAIPDTTITFRFDDLDLYLELETVLQASATYTLKLIPPGFKGSGIELTNNIVFGVVYSADLILSIDGELDITGGLHIKIDDHVAMQLELFGDKVSDMSLEGGHFELLPVTVRSASASFTATLRLGAKAAMTVGNLISLPDSVPDSLREATVGDVSLSDLTLAGGILMGVNADVAVFKTSFEVDPANPVCRFKIKQDYSLVLGATAGAQVTVGTVTYGPAIAKTTPVYTTELTTSCAVNAAATITPTAIVQKRQAPTGEYNTELTTTLIYTVIECPASVTGDCPVALQTTVKQIEPLTTTVYADSKDDLPSEYPTSTTATAAITRVPLGTGAQKLERISGSPSTYTAGPTTIVEEVIEAAKRNKRTIAIGVGVGLGVPLLFLIGALIFFCVRRKKSPSAHKPT